MISFITSLAFVIVAFMKDKPIGMVGLKEQGAKELSHLTPKNAPWIGALFVEETQRKKGIGKQLLNLALTKKNAKDLILASIYFASQYNL